MKKQTLDAFIQVAEQENNILTEDLIGGTQGNCHVSGTNAGNGGTGNRMTGSTGWTGSTN